MENYILYDELFKDDTAITYKGRRKGSIQFVAIHCIDKSRRPEVTNRVRLTHELEHANVVQFLEWYETTNHLWLIVELCTGGRLQVLLDEDHHLPESSVMTFGLDIVRGLHYLHSLGILYCDLQPSKVLLDGPGTLKFDDFCLARVEGEDLDELFEMTGGESGGSADSGEQASGSPKQRKTLGNPNYMAPEVLQGQSYSLASDLWALGCVLYQLYTGHVPFEGNTFPELVDKVLNADVPVPKVKGPRLASKPSPDFCSLLDGLLDKNPDKRINWHELVEHPFWQGELCVGQADSDTDQIPTISVDEPTDDGMTKTGSSLEELTRTPTSIKKYNLVDISPDGRPVSSLRASSQHHLLRASLLSSAMSNVRPQTSPDVSQMGKDAQFTLSSRPITSPAPEPPVKADIPHKAATKKATRKKSTSTKKNGGGEGVKVKVHYPRERMGNTQGDGDRGSRMDLIYTVWDLNVSPIQDNPKIQKLASMKFDAKSLSFPAHNEDKLDSMSERHIIQHLDNIADVMSKMAEKSSSSQRSKLQIMNYLASVCSNPAIGVALLQSKLLSSLTSCIKSTQALELRCKCCRVIGLMSLNIIDLPEDVQLTEVFMLLSEVIRDNTRNAKLKQSVLPALGELFYLVAVQEEQRPNSIEAWTMPSLTYTVLSRCLREAEDPIVQHCAAKTIDNVATTSSVHSTKLATNENGQLLWHLFTHSADSLKVSAVSALCRITQHSGNLFQGVIDKVGLPSVLESLGVHIGRVQQAMLTMLTATLSEGNHLHRLIQDKDFVSRVMKLIESPSIVIRAKAFLTVLHVVENNLEMLPITCQAKLIMYIERDSRRQTTSSTKPDNQSQWEYLSKCLHLLTEYLIEIMPQILADAVNSLAAVSGRKHPSSIQAKQLKTNLPLVPVALHMVTSTSLRSNVISEQFLVYMGDLLNHVKSLDSGETNIESAISESGTNEFINTVLSIVEAITQHPAILIQLHSVIVESVLPPLAALMSSQKGETRIFCLRLFTEIASLYLTHDHLTEEQTLIADSSVFQEVIASEFVPHCPQILLDPDPLPLYALKLLLALLERNPAYTKQIEQLDLVPILFQVLDEHQTSLTGSVVRHVLGIINCMAGYEGVHMQGLYGHGVVDHICIIFQDVSRLYGPKEGQSETNQSTTLLLITLLDLILTLLKFVAATVKQVLQAKKAGSAADTRGAEVLLLANKPVVELMDHIMELLLYPEKDVQYLATESLSLVGQLYGGEYPHTMSEPNMQCLANALMEAEGKRQKVLLRFIKRMVSTEPQHAQMLSQKGGELIEVLHRLQQTASSHADIALSSLAGDILKATTVS